MVSNQSYYDLLVSNQSDFLDHFVKNYSGKEFTTEDLMKDKIIGIMTLPPFPKEIYEKCKELQEKSPNPTNEKSPKKSPKKSVKQEKPKKSTKQDKPKKETSPRKKSLEDRSNEGVNHGKCLCRLWKNGLDNIQCSGNKVDGTDFCKRHSEFGVDWWCGLITEQRPEEPIGPSTKPVENRSRHYWHDQEKPKKKKKKSAEKKDKDTVSDNSEDEDIKIAGGVGEIPETPKVNENVDALPDDIESSDDEDTEETTDFEIDGVIYTRLMKDDMIMDKETGTQMAYLKEGKFTEFFDEDAKKLHESKK